MLHLVGDISKGYLTMHGPLNVKLTEDRLPILLLK